MRATLLRPRVRAAVLLAALAAAAASTTIQAGEVRVAVAANFTQAAREIGAVFEATIGHKAIFSFGSTGQLYAQITQDAPFEAFLAADRLRPRRAEAEGHAVPGSRFTYATGKIVLFSRDPQRVVGEATLRDGAFTRIAIANPVTAPYGSAAVEAMKALGVYEAIAPKVAQGNNVAQTYQFVETGNAEVGFVALSQVARHKEGSRWLVPETLYTAVAQDAVLLKRGAGNAAAHAFLSFLRGRKAKAVVASYGYGTGE